MYYPFSFLREYFGERGEIVRMKSKKNTFVSRAAVGCVTTAIFLLLCIIKGIYPFGIATLDTVDFQSQWIPAYYHVWDVLHGDGSAFFDWRVGGGNNFAGVLFY